MENISRKDAKSCGIKFYFTGNPCSAGGIGPRLTSNGRCYCNICKKKIKSQKASDYQIHKQKRDLSSCSWKKANPEKVKEIEAKSKSLKKKTRAAIGRPRLDGTYYERNKEKIKELRKQPHRREKILAAKRKYKEKNKSKVRSESSTRRAKRRQAIPSWFGEFDKLVLEEAVNLCLERTKETGIDWHLDHMIPLCAEEACGLHCAENFQVIPSTMNLAKGNRLWYVERNSWLRQEIK